MASDTDLNLLILAEAVFLASKIEVGNEKLLTNKFQFDILIMILTIENNVECQTPASLLASLGQVVSQYKGRKNNMINKNQFLSTTKLAEILNISRVAVLKRIWKGKIKAVKVGRNYIVDKEDIKEILNNKKGKKYENLYRRKRIREQLATTIS